MKTIFKQRKKEEGVTKMETNGISKKKKFIIAVSMMLVLAVAGYLNIVLLDSGSQIVSGNEGVVDGDIFMTYRENRQTTRNEELLSLESVIALTGEEFAESRQEAVNNKLKLVELMETELLLESLIKAKGYEDAVVNMGIYSDNINVMVKCEELTRQDTAIIYSVIADVTGIQPSFVNIIHV